MTHQSTPSQRELLPRLSIPLSQVCLCPCRNDLVFGSSHSFQTNSCQWLLGLFTSILSDRSHKDQDKQKLDVLYDIPCYQCELSSFLILKMFPFSAQLTVILSIFFLIGQDSQTGCNIKLGVIYASCVLWESGLLHTASSGWCTV